MFGWRKSVQPIEVWSNGTFPIELSRGRQTNPKKRVPLKAEVDEETGRVSFYIDPSDIQKLS